MGGGARAGMEAGDLANLSAAVQVRAQELMRMTGGVGGAVAADLGKIAAAAGRLCGLVQEFSLPEAADRHDVATARHDLRTPLNHILGYTEMLLEDLDGDASDPLIPGLQLVHMDAKRLLDLVNALHRLPLPCRPTPASPGAAEPPAVASVPTPDRPRQSTRAAPQVMRSGDPPLILVVDDVETNREVLSRRLHRLGYGSREAVDGQQALAMAAETPFDLVLLDIMMPGIDGYEVLTRLKADPETAHIPVIMISAVGDMDSVVRCIEMGAEDYLPKPFDPVLLNARLNASLSKKRLHDQERHYRQQIENHNLLLEQRVREQVREISQAQLSAIFALSKLAESRDPETGAHLERMREYCRILARELSGLPQYQAMIDERYLENLYAASPLHDIGKVGIPDEILLKPGRLTAEEFAVMRSHPLIGAETLRAVDRQHPGNGLIRFGIEIAEAHHERWDGSGYPFGLAGEAIPLSARIVALADVYDALRSRRVYKSGMDHGQAREIILESSGSHFDPQLVAAFQAIEDELQYVWSHLQDE